MWDLILWLGSQAHWKHLHARQGLKRQGGWLLSPREDLLGAALQPHQDLNPPAFPCLILLQNLNIQVEDIRIRPVLSAFQHRHPVTEGFVEVKEGKTWKQICDKHWTAKNSHVVCGMFGFPAERSYNTKAYK